VIPGDEGDRRRVFVAGGFIDTSSVSTARVFCIEDRWKQ
jgi:hypothetical protein